MQIRYPTRESLVFDRVGGGVALIALSLALVAPRAFDFQLFLIAAIATFSTLPMSLARQERAVADFSRVPSSERRTYLVWDTVLALSMLACFGIAFFLAWTSYPLRVRIGVGLLALIWMAVAHTVRSEMSMRHGASVSVDSATPTRPMR